MAVLATHRGREAPIARHVNAVRLLRNGCGIVELAIAVDHQARIARQDGGHIKPRRQPPRNIGGADIPGDMQPTLSRIQAEITQRRRNGRRGMIAKQQGCRPTVRVAEFDRRWIAGAEQGSRQRLVFHRRALEQIVRSAATSAHSNSP